MAPSLSSRLPKIRIARDRSGFVTEKGDPFVPFGVNYFRPGTGWAPQVWKRFDPEKTRKDLRLLKEYGGNCVRVFLTFGSFYMKPGELLEEGLRKFDQFLQIAEEEGIYVHPTGPDHWEGLPDWVKGASFADETFLKALVQFWKLLVGRYKGLNTLFAYDLLNEPTVGWDDPQLQAQWQRFLKKHYGSLELLAQVWGLSPSEIPGEGLPVPPPEEDPGGRRLLDFQLFREEVADEWTRRQVEAIKSVDPEALVTVGLIQWSVPCLLPGVRHYSAFRPERQARYLDFMEIHFYPLDEGGYHYRSKEEKERNLAYLESVVGETARPGLPVVLAEFGWYGGGALREDLPPASEENQADWCVSVVQTTAGLAHGWLNWGFYDHPEAKDVSRLTGLFTAGGREKAWGRRFRELAHRYAGKKIPRKKLGYRPTLDWDLCITSLKAGNEYRTNYYQAFIADSLRSTS